MLVGQCLWVCGAERVLPAIAEGGCGRVALAQAAGPRRNRDE